MLTGSLRIQLFKERMALNEGEGKKGIYRFEQQQGICFYSLKLLY